MNPEQFNRQPDLYGSADKPELYESANEQETPESSEAPENSTEEDEMDTESGGFWEGTKESWGTLKEEIAERLKSPEFQEAIDKEKTEFMEQLSDAKNSSLDFLYKGLIKKVLIGTVSDEVKSTFNGKYKMGKSFKKTTKRVAGAGFMGLKAVGKIAGAAGKGLKIGARYLAAK